MTKNPSPVLLDRLSHVLEKQGVRLKRQQLLDTAAYAFGFRHRDVFSAAAKAGEITPPPVIPIGRVSLANGEKVLIVTDPLAESAYGIDEAFVERSMDERREHIGVTPYGHLVSICQIADQVIPDLVTAAADKSALASEHAAEDDHDSIRISRDDLKQVIGAAQSWAEDINSGLADGTYENDAGVKDVEASIGTLLTRLRMKSSPSAKAASHAPKPDHLTIHIGTITHRHGEDVKLSLSADGLDHEIAEYCRENWDDITGAEGVPGNPVGMTESDIVSVYFDACQKREMGQYIDRTSQDVPIPGQMIAASGGCARCGSGLVFGMCSDETCPFHDVPQTDPRGWSDHPQIDPFPKDDHIPVAAPKALEGKPADWSEQIAQALEEGAVADIWYDAPSFGGSDPQDPDRIAEESINETQQAMQEAARILRELKPIRLPDGKIMIDGLIPSPKRINRRTAAVDADEPLWITDSDGEDTGQATLTMLHEARIGYQYENGEFHPLTEHEQEMSLPWTTLNAHCDNMVRMGFTVLWRGRKWYAPEVQFAWDENQSFKDGGDEALSRAKTYMEDIRPMVESLGGHLRLDEYPTEFAHELAILLPVELSMSTGDPDDWRDALSYLLMTSEEKAKRPRAFCEFTAETHFHKYTMSIEPLGDTVWDATFDALRWGTQDAISIITGQSDPDDYARSRLAPKWVQDWAGTNPFEVQVIGLKECLNIIM